LSSLSSTVAVVAVFYYSCLVAVVVHISIIIVIAVIVITVLLPLRPCLVFVFGICALHSSAGLYIEMPSWCLNEILLPAVGIKKRILVLSSSVPLWASSFLLVSSEPLRLKFCRVVLPLLCVSVVGLELLGALFFCCAAYIALLSKVHCRFVGVRCLIHCVGVVVVVVVVVLALV